MPVATANIGLLVLKNPRVGCCAKNAVRLLPSNNENSNIPSLVKPEYIPRVSFRWIKTETRLIINPAPGAGTKIGNTAAPYVLAAKIWEFFKVTVLERTGLEETPPPAIAVHAPVSGFR